MCRSWINGNRSWIGGWMVGLEDGDDWEEGWVEGV